MKAELRLVVEDDINLAIDLKPETDADFVILKLIASQNIEPLSFIFESDDEDELEHCFASIYFRHFPAAEQVQKVVGR